MRHPDVPGLVPAHTELPDGQVHDRRNLRNALGMFATGVTVITTRRADGSCVGFTANSFSSVSLEPPLILFSLGSHSPSLPDFLASSHFAINILSENQQELSRRFATSSPDKFADLEWQAGRDGVPLLPGCCAWFECANEMRHSGGDHVIFIGRVLAYAREEQAPLLFHGGQYGRLVRC